MADNNVICYSSIPFLVEVIIILQRKIKKLIPVICSLIIGLSSFSVSAAVSDEVLYSSSNLSDLLYCPDLTLVSSGSNSVGLNYIDFPYYTFSLERKLDKINVNFNFNLLNLDISRYKNYRFELPFAFFVSPTRFQIKSISIIFYIKYTDGSVSSYTLSPSSLDVIDNDTYYLYCPFDFVISGNKILNISDSYFAISYPYSSLGYGNAVFGLKRGSSFVISSFYPEYDSFFSSSLNWVSDIFKMVTDNLALVVLCIGFPVVTFSFLLLRRLLRS